MFSVSNLIWGIAGGIIVVLLLLLVLQFSPEARLRRRRRKSNSRIVSKTDRPSVKFSVKPPKE